MAMIDLKKNLPKLLKGNPFWQDMMDAFSEEIDAVHQEIELKRILFDIALQDESEELLETARMLGYTPDLSVDDSIENLKSNVLSAVFRIINKSSLGGYQYIFRSLPYPGDVFPLFLSGKLIRAQENLSGLISKLNAVVDDATVAGLQPFLFSAEDNFVTFLFSQLHLDSGLFLDSTSSPWFLDTATSTVSTKHIATEFQINTLLTVDDVEYIMTPLYLDYLKEAVDYNRRVTEIPHVGANLSLVGSGHPVTDHWYPNNEGYTMPVIKTSSIVSPHFYSLEPIEEGFETLQTVVDQIATVRVGSGSHDLPRTNAPSISIPTDLENTISISELVGSEKEQLEDWTIIQTMINTNKVEREVLDIADPSTTYYSGTLARNNLSPGSVIITIPTLEGVLQVHDDLGGGLVYDSPEFGSISFGTINYATGEYTIDLVSQTPIYREFSYESNQVQVTESLEESIPVVPGSVSLTWQLPIQGGVGRTVDSPFPANDPDYGIFVHKSLDENEDNYISYYTEATAGKPPNQFVLTFADGFATNNIVLTYQQEVAYTALDQEPITAEYLISGDTYITEAGLFDDNDNLLAYATFPPFHSNSFAYHIGIQFMFPTNDPTA